MTGEEYTEIAGGPVERGGFATVGPVKRKSDGKVGDRWMPSSTRYTLSHVDTGL